MDQELKQQFDNIDQRFEKLMIFLHQNMVTKEEFNDLAARVTKLEETVARLVDAVEKLTTAVNKVVEEHTILKHQIMAMQEWIRKAAEKIGVEFKL